MKLALRAVFPASILLPALLLPMAPAVSAQQADANSDHALIEQLLQRVNELESEVKSLKEARAVAAQASGAPESAANSVVAAPHSGAPSSGAPSSGAQGPGTQPAEASLAAPPPAPPAGSAAGSPANSGPGSVPAAAAALAASSTGAAVGALPQQTMHDVSIPGTEGMQFRGFSDVRFHEGQATGPASSFQLGQFNLFITSKINSQFGVLSEMVVEADPNNVMGIDLERLLFEYTPNDYFNVSVGRYHSAIGFYNTAYHHSTWLQTTVDRPFLFAFEDEGGILPIHNVGLSVTGRIPSGGLGLHYVAEMGNGRASRSPLDEPVQNAQDENNGKAYNLALFARPAGIPGFQAGFSFYRDRLYPQLTQGTLNIGQDIFAAHIIYQANGVEFMNEAVVLRHAVVNGPIYHIPAFYSQVSKQFGRFRPYFRYEYMNVPSQDPLFGDVGLRYGPLTGIRYDFSDFAAFKIEYDRTIQRLLAPANGLQSQVTFTF
jgi:hypothetical protein